MNERAIAYLEIAQEAITKSKLADPAGLAFYQRIERTISAALDHLDAKCVECGADAMMRKYTQFTGNTGIPFCGDCAVKSGNDDAKWEPISR